MYKKIIPLLFLLFCLAIGHSQSQKIKIRSDNLQEVNYLKMDDFYLTHHLYIDLFLRENLFPQASPEDVSAVLKAIKKYVSEETGLTIEIEKPGERNYLIRIAILKNDDGTELLTALTNWSVKKRVFEKEIKIENDSYARWYFLNGDKMTYRKDMSNKNDYSKMDRIDLANAYLFDELPDNDTEIGKTIAIKLISSPLNVSDTIMANLVLLKYYIFMRDMDEVAKQTTHVSELFQKNKGETNLNGLRMAFEATKFQIELMK